MAIPSATRVSNRTTATPRSAETTPDSTSQRWRMSETIAGATAACGEWLAVADSERAASWMVRRRRPR